MLKDLSMRDDRLILLQRNIINEEWRSPVLAGLEEVNPSRSSLREGKAVLSPGTGDMGSSDKHLPDHPLALNPNHPARFCLDLKG